ncbi:hypothetical protein ABZY31_28080 [Streptomyces sp. NPDC006529]|uniref:hypothetical protein n=1 Tax=Streptomyces sp. NPDC006529 TaxID=3157177 RepID=UPI0033B912F2
MREFSRWVALRPWMQGALVAVFGAGVILLLGPGSSPFAAVLRGISGAVGATAVMMMIRRRERRASGVSTAEDYVSLDDRLRHGEVPDSPEERAEMGRLVTDRLRRVRHRRWALIFLFLMFGSVTVLAAVGSGFRQGALTGVLSAVFLAWITWYGARQQRLLRRMAAELASAAPGKV